MALADGRIALSGVPDYSPANLPASSWNKRLAIFWLPAWGQTAWAQFQGPGNVRLISRSPTQRLLLVQAAGPGVLLVQQWAHPSWRVQVRAVATGQRPAGPWNPPLQAGGRGSDGWIRVPLAAGVWQVVLHYGHQLP